MALRTICIAFAGCLWLLVNRCAWAVERVVATTSEFSAALAAAEPDDEIVLQPGTYVGGHFRANLRQVTIRSLDPANPATIDGGNNAIQLSDAQHVTIENLVFRNQTGNGLNIDDGGSFDTPSTDITLRNITVRDIVTAGNHDGIKLSGVDHFFIDGVQVLNWGSGGSAVDMVGCHHGLIQNSRFEHTNTSNAGTTLQPKGGSKDITFRANRIELPRGAGRAVQAGGSTGTPFFRFVDGDSGYEADEITAEGNVIVGGSSAFSWVNIDGGVFHHNVVHRPGQWVARILNENQGNPIVDTQNGRFHDNRIVLNDVAGEFSTAVNVGPETLPQTYYFARNKWLNLANPTPAGSTPNLPVPDEGGMYGGDPMADPDAAQIWDFPWGKWIVNANAAEKVVELPGFNALRRARPEDATARFLPLEADPLDGPWSLEPLATGTIELPAFSQLILVDPPQCPGCVGVVGDYDQNGLVDAGDYDAWRAAFGTADAAVDGNGDGVVDAADYVLWRRALSQPQSAIVDVAATMIVAEPTSVAIAGAVGFCAALVRCRIVTDATIGRDDRGRESSKRPAIDARWQQGSSSLKVHTCDSQIPPRCRTKGVGSRGPCLVE